MIMLSGFTLGFIFPKQARLVNVSEEPLTSHPPVETVRREAEPMPRDAEIEYVPFLHIHRRF
jgi:hypothetical protein